MPAGSEFAARAAASKVLDPTHQSIVPKVNNVGAPGTVASRLRAWNNLSEIRRLARPNEPDWNPDTTPPDALDLTKFIEVCVGTSAEGFTDGAMRPRMQGMSRYLRSRTSGVHQRLYRSETRQTTSEDSTRADTRRTKKHGEDEKGNGERCGPVEGFFPTYVGFCSSKRTRNDSLT